MGRQGEESVTVETFGGTKDLHYWWFYNLPDSHSIFSLLLFFQYNSLMFYPSFFETEVMAHYGVESAGLENNFRRRPTIVMMASYCQRPKALQ